MTFSTPNKLDGFSPRNYSAALTSAPWFHSRYKLNDDTIMRYVRGDNLPDHTPRFALDCDNFRSHMCAVDTELKTAKFGHRSARQRFVDACKVHWGSLRGKILLPAAAVFDLSFARSDDEYSFCSWLTLELEEDASHFAGELYYQWQGIRNVSQLVLDAACARPSLTADFRNLPKVHNIFGDVGLRLSVVFLINLDTCLLMSGWRSTRLRILLEYLVMFHCLRNGRLLMS